MKTSIMKQVGLWLIAVVLPQLASAQLLIGGSEAPRPSAVLELKAQYGASQTGGLRLPQLTSSQRDGLTTVLTSAGANAIGLVIMNVTTNYLEFWDGIQWVSKGATTPNTVISSVTVDNTVKGLCIGSATGPADYSVLELSGGSSRGLLLPRITAAELISLDAKLAVLSSSEKEKYKGLMVMETSNNQVGIYDGSGWIYLK